MTRTSAAIAGMTAVVSGSLIAVAAGAGATAATRTGWWNTLSAGTVSAPAPTVPAGGIRVAATAGQATAFGAVLFDTAAASGKLRFQVADVTATPSVQACPLSIGNWSAGDDQPSSTAPGYDCTTAAFPGRMSANGQALEFSVNAFGQVRPGEMGFALVPASAAPVPATFSLDLSKPGADAFTAQPATSAAVVTAGEPASTSGVTATDPEPHGASTSDTTVAPNPPADGASSTLSPEPPPVVAGSRVTALPTAAPVARRTAHQRGPNKAGLACAAVLLSLAAWIRFQPIDEGTVNPSAVRQA